MHYIFFTSYMQIFCSRLLHLSLTAVRISLTVFFSSSVLLIQIYLRSNNSQRLFAVILPD